MQLSKYINVILHKPQLGENIGAAARVMANFDCDWLSLVAPRDGWPNPKALVMATHGENIIKNAKVFPELNDSLAETELLFAITARMRGINKPVYTAKLGAEIIKEKLKEGARIGLLFGSENNGLANEEVALANAIITIPASATYSSLNLAQAVGVILYEIFQSSNGLKQINYATKQDLATKQEVVNMVEHLHSVLETKGYYKETNKIPRMLANLHGIFARNELSAQEVRTLRGIIDLFDNPNSDN